MGKPTGFLEWDRQTPEHRPVPVRLRDWNEVYEPFDAEALNQQAGAWTAVSRSVTTVARWAT